MLSLLPGSVESGRRTLTIGEENRKFFLLPDYVCLEEPLLPLLLQLPLEVFPLICYTLAKFCSKITQCIPNSCVLWIEKKGNGVHESCSAGSSAHYCVCCSPYFREYIELMGIGWIDWRLSRAPHQYSHLAHHLCIPCSS